MKILVATGAYPPDIGGPATYSELLYNELPKRGVACEVLSFGEVRHLPKIIRHVAYFGKVMWHARAADVVFAQDAVSVGLPAILAAHLLGKAFVVRVPGDHAWEQSTQRYGVKEGIDEFQTRSYGGSVERLRKIQRFVVRHADRVIAPSKYFANIVRTWTNKPERVEHIYNGIDLGEIHAAVGGAGAATGARVTPTAHTIVTAARLVPWKGFPMLIHAMKKLPGWKLAIAGDGPEKNALEKLIADEHLGDRVTLLGRIDRKSLAKAIASAEVFALNTHYETFSFMLVEAMATGTPVITTNVSNLLEIVDDGKNGLLIKPDDEAAFIAAVQKLDKDTALRARIGKAGRAKADMFSIDSTVTKALAAMNAVLDRRPIEAKKAILAAKLIRYLFSGGLAAVTDIGLLWILVYPLHLSPVISSVIAFVFAFGVSFFMQKFFTFQDNDTKGMHGQAAIYLVVTGANLGINTLLMYVATTPLHMNAIISQILISILLAIESYVLYGMVIFKDKGTPAIN